MQSQRPNSNIDHRIHADLGALVKLQYQADGFSFLPRQPMLSVLAGRHGSKVRGRGLNFEELRRYQAGDDIRHLDWKVTKRTKVPHVRVYTEERERNVLLIIDQRTSMFFGSQIRMKSVTALEAAALTAWKTLSVGDRIGAIVFNDEHMIDIKPQRHRHTVMQIFQHAVHMNHSLHAGSHRQNGAQLNQALLRASHQCRHDYLVVLVSDVNGWDEESLKRVKLITQHNDLIVGFIFDPLEKSLPQHQHLVVSDGAIQIAIDARAPKLQTQYTDTFTNQVDLLQRELSKHGVPVIPIDTIAPVVQQIRRALGHKV